MGLKMTLGNGYHTHAVNEVLFTCDGGHLGNGGDLTVVEDGSGEVQEVNCFNWCL